MKESYKQKSINEKRLKPCCNNCIHFGEILESGGRIMGNACLAPITTEPPQNGETLAKNRFVYFAYPNNLCELHTPNT